MNMPVPPCVVLAGGLGTRLRSVVADRPKCLAPVGQTVFLDIQLRTLQAQGITDIVLSLGHESQQVLDWLATGAAAASPQRVRTVVEPAPLGTGGAIAFAMDTLGLDEALVANGDTFLDGALGEMLQPLRPERQEWFRMALVQVPDRTRFGGVSLQEDGRITGFVPKGSSTAGPINAGLYRLKRQALPARSDQPFSIESDVLPGLVAQGHVHGVPIAGAFTDIGVPQDYAAFCARHG
jgi:D-glycero-alpha-D-manno-heptose 1-phosphate guanylyltransferase